jgi:two-component system, OmpR family, sensor histidine kinase KdpD
MKVRGLRLVVSILGVAVLTFLASRVIPVNATTAGFAYLLYVLIVASVWGFMEAAVSSVAATLTFNFFFLPPVGTLTIADPQNWIALFTFLVTSLIASRLSTAAKDRAADAIARQQDLERLYTLGRAILLIDAREPFAKELCRKVAETFELTGVALYVRWTGEIYRASAHELEGIDLKLRETAANGTTATDAERKLVITAIRLGSEPIASLALEGARLTDSVLQSIANLVAIGLERAKAQTLAHEVEVTRRSEQLRTTLIDAMAHEFKTPLTAVRAATSALLANPDQKLSSAMKILQIADEEAAHLQELIDNALDLSQLDSDHIDLDVEIADLEAVIRELVASMKAKIGDRQFEFVSNGPLPPVACDRRLIKLAVRQLLDNALKYSPSNSPVSIRAFRSDDSLGLQIVDHGKGIPAEQQAHVFERFYRSPSVQDQIPGSGLGLSIAHRIVHAHGGELGVKSRPGETVFTLTLPVERPVSVSVEQKEKTI